MSTPQEPIGSGFSAASTATEVVRGCDLRDKVAIVTGGASGIGVETVRALRSAGAAVVVPARDRDTAARALAGIDGVAIAAMDLMDADSIDAFAADFRAMSRPLHILVNSAGIMACPLTRDARGHEAQFATNHLGHFQLTLQLWPALVQASGARVVSVSSWGHRRSPVVFDDPNFERRAYDRWSAYGQSKTANILFARALDAWGAAHGVRAFALHPGSIVGTGLEKHLTRDELRGLGVIDEAGRPILDAASGRKTVAQGAATSVWCATSPLLAGLGGVYCENCDIAPLASSAGVADQRSDAVRRAGATAHGVMPHAVDPVAAERLWHLSERLVGVGRAIPA